MKKLPLTLTAAGLPLAAQSACDPSVPLCRLRLIATH